MMRSMEMCKICVNTKFGNECPRTLLSDGTCPYFKNYRDYIKPDINVGDKFYVRILDKYFESAIIKDIYLDYFGVHILFEIGDGSCGSFMPTDIGKSVFSNLSDALDSCPNKK